MLGCRSMPSRWKVRPWVTSQQLIGLRAVRNLATFRATSPQLKPTIYNPGALDRIDRINVGFSEIPESC